MRLSIGRHTDNNGNYHPADMNYYYRDNTGKEIGPLTLNALAKLRFAGVVSGDTSIRAADSTDWKPCREVIADTPTGAPVTLSTPPAAPKVEISRRTKIYFVVSVILGCLIYGAGALYRSLSEKSSVAFDFAVDGKPLLAGARPDVQLDGRTLETTSGATVSSAIPLGWHKVAVHLADVEPYTCRFWVVYGVKNLGALPLESSKGSLAVVVNPLPAKVTVERGGEVFYVGDAPLKVDKLPVGNYSLIIRHGEYEERQPVTIQRQQLTNTKVELNLGSVELSSDPADAEYVLSGNGKIWNGKLPAKIVDIPVGSEMLIGNVPGRSYDLLVRRKGWELSASVLISRGSILTNRVEFPYGSIEVTSDPTGLVVSDNGVEVGKTPVLISEAHGLHTLVATDGENDMTMVVGVGNKEAAKKNFQFRYSTFELASTPPGATVIRKGKEVGKTPLTLEHIPIGETTVALKLDGYVTTNTALQVVEGGAAHSTVKLISERYLTNLSDARRAIAANPSDYQHALESINQALQIYPDAVEAIQLRNDCEFGLSFNEAWLLFGKNDLDVAASKIETALALKPANPEAVGLKNKIAVAQAALTQKRAVERANAVGPNFEKLLADVAKQARQNSPQVIAYQTYAWKVNANPGQAKGALLRTIKLSSPQWTMSKEDQTAPDLTILHLRASVMLLSSRYHLVVQICQLSNNVLDVRTKMLYSLFPGDPPDRIYELLKPQYLDFIGKFDGELKAISR